MHPTNLLGMEMMVIAAVVLGGTAITGGEDPLTGVMLGTLLIVIVQNSMILTGIPSSGRASPWACSSSSEPASPALQVVTGSPGRTVRGDTSRFSPVARLASQEGQLRYAARHRFPCSCSSSSRPCAPAPSSPCARGEIHTVHSPSSAS